MQLESRFHRQPSESIYCRNSNFSQRKRGRGSMKKEEEGWIRRLRERLFSWRGLYFRDREGWKKRLDLFSFSAEGECYRWNRFFNRGKNFLCNRRNGSVCLSRCLSAIDSLSPDRYFEMIRSIFVSSFLPSLFFFFSFLIFSPLIRHIVSPRRCRTNHEKCMNEIARRGVLYRSFMEIFVSNGKF